MQFWRILVITRFQLLASQLRY